MAYRWKVPEFNSGVVDPDAMHDMMVRRQIDDIMAIPGPNQLALQRQAQQNMRGYASPNTAGMGAAAQMQGYQPTGTNWDVIQAGAVTNGDRGGYNEVPAYQREMQRQELQARYQKLQNELNQIDTQIAEVKRKYPGITNEREWRIAAKRAEIGDMSAYDNMMARGRDASQGVTGVENSLYNVLKLGWGLKTNKDEDAQITLANMNTELQKAEEWSQKTGQPLPRVYYEVKNAVDEYYAKHKNGGTGGDLVRNAEEAINKLNNMVAEGNFPKEEYDKYYNWVKQNPNSEFAKPLGDWLVANKGKTNEARAAGAALATKVKALFKKMRDNHMTPLDQSAEYNKLSKTEKRAFDRLYKWENGTGYSAR